MATNHFPTLKELIERNGLLQRELAQKLDVDQSQLNRWVRGEVTPLRFRRQQIERFFKQEIKWPSA